MKVISVQYCGPLSNNFLSSSLACLQIDFSWLAVSHIYTCNIGVASWISELNICIQFFSFFREVCFGSSRIMISDKYHYVNHLLYKCTYVYTQTFPQVLRSTYIWDPSTNPKVTWLDQPPNWPNHLTCSCHHAQQTDLIIRFATYKT